MSNKTANRSTGIEWTEHTWNPFVGCTIHSAGCTNCYAMRTAYRLQESGIASYRGTAAMANGSPVWTGQLHRASDEVMRKPLKIKQPSLIFVNSMSDFFHADALDEWRIEAMSVMARTPHHYQILTKRPENIQPFFDRINHLALISLFPNILFSPNMWIGVTVERADAVHRIDTLRQVQSARIKFLSIEPLIDSVGPLNLKGIDWVILGGESGPNARPMTLEWAREVRDQCLAQKVPLFFKQWGQSSNNPLWNSASVDLKTRANFVASMDPVGKGGSLLDGVEWKQYPNLSRQS